MNTEHTPGPWEARGNPNPQDGHYSHWIDGGEPQPFPLAEVRSYPNGESEANASLIAAAPDLLQALEAIAGEGQPGHPSLLYYYHRETCEMPDNCEHCRLVAIARTAIKAARRNP